MDKLNIIVVDDHATFRDGISFYLEEILGYNVIAQYSNGKEFLESKLIPVADFILMDIQMPVMNGFEAIKKALWKHPYIKVIAITNYSHNTHLRELILNGFKGCVLKDNVYENLKTAIADVSKGKVHFNDNINF
ncbi:response regulator transcription factor [Labilibacter sediminis]|nr:response regulator transcription factor [Labilibacter sediminis]